MRSNRSINNTASVILLLILFSSMIVAVLCLIDIQRANGYTLLFLLPLTYFLSSCILIQRKVYKQLFHSITGIIVLGVYYIRMVISPLVMCLGSYNSVFGNSQYVSDFGLAIVMVCIEYMVVSMYLPITVSKNLIQTGVLDYSVSKERRISLTETRPRQLLWVLIIGMSLFIIYVIRIDQTVLKSTFVFLLDTKREYVALSDLRSGIGTLSMFIELLSASFKILQVLLPPMLLWYVIRSKMNISIKYLITFAMFCLVSTIGTENRIDSIFAGLALLITVKATFGESFRGRFKWWLIGIMAVGLVGLSLKTGVGNNTSNQGVNDFESISSMILAYFSGIPTVAAGLNMVHSTPGANILHIFPDILNRIPFMGYALNLLFGISLIDSNQMFNHFISANWGRNYGQILPTTAVGYEYLFILFPVVPCIMVNLAVQLEKKARIQTDIVRTNLFNWITICVAASPVVASSLLMVNKISWFIIIWIILWLFDKRAKSRERLQQEER